MHALDVYKNIDRVGKRVVMVGGGLVGCETGLHLSKLGRQVTIIEMTDKVAGDAYVMHRVGLLEEMEKHNQLICRTGLKCCEIMANGVKVTDKEGKEEFIEADTVVYALGMKANSIPDNLLAAVAGMQVFTIGDCVRAAKVQQAIEDGFLAGMKIV
jgi:pyruvate/2-oxoglutarate dehydrogenase complex dihydrolipoamide dehydrogenase (E3) component